MKKSNSQQPDLDWSQVRETVKLLTLSAAQVQMSMNESDDSVTTLTESFTDMVAHISEISKFLESVPVSVEKEKAIESCQIINEKVHSSVVAFQFYDRMQQCLQHAVDNLDGLSTIVDNPRLLYNPLEWRKLQDRIREGFTMESEKLMFDAILQGKTVEEAKALATQVENSTSNEDDIELF